ncbi:growth/differentiation factor 10 [Alligator mississippiensis]|uniref:Bone morphogenetic protein 3 n=1 Tax=Alligator mississippiensis TaxID=8496 RepID=A0A151MKV8_ALLMI|nr:growth/differentiation factor 10 [Alligator mississippiensis]KYO25164.1 growth/differentiation factor 10 [Alligator mississippiensis]
MPPACPPMAGRLACCLLLGLLGRGGCHALPAREEPRAPDFSPAGTHPRGDAALGGIARDVVAVHMLKLYERYNREGSRPGDGNTVRSFRARLELLSQKPLYCFNLTSMQDSEMILAATFHFYSDKRPRHQEVFCKRSKNSSCRLLHLPQIPRLNLIFRSIPQNSAYGLVKGNVTVFPQRRGSWQVKDISHIINESKLAGELILCAELDSGEKYQGIPEQVARHFPYILVYANDLAIAEPNSVAVTLQRYDPFPSSDGDPSLSPNASSDTRVRRDTYLSSSIQNNELPEVEYINNDYNKHDIWESAYKSLKPRTSRKDRRRKGHENTETLTKSQMLNFDEKTMKKARRKQWNEPRICSRRYMKVDFADIGWNEWIISPKSFDAYYCAGACEFPMPKIVRPSNHATIQSIVKAVGIIPGIPEPCCVPDKMNSLSVLFLDENKNVVLKVYPNMSVETCACR